MNDALGEVDRLRRHCVGVSDRRCVEKIIGIAHPGFRQPAGACRGPAQGGLWTEPDTIRDGPCPACIAPLFDQLAFKLSQRSKDMQYQPALWSGGVDRIMRMFGQNI